MRSILLLTVLVFGDPCLASKVDDAPKERLTNEINESADSTQIKAQVIRELNKQLKTVAKKNNGETENKKDMPIPRISLDRRAGAPFKPVIFTAGLTRQGGDIFGFTPIYLSSGRRLVFNKVVINIGDAYTNGVFIAPVHGAYEFSVSLLSGYKKDNPGNAYVRHNGHNVAKIVAGPAESTFATMSIDIVLDLNARDSVDVVSWSNDHFIWCGPTVPVCWFTGKLLTPL